MIKQHFFGRTEKGLFTNMQGYDTIFKSDQLNENYIKKYIHKYCVYNRHLYDDDEKNINPDIYFFSSFYKDGNLNYVLGKSKYIQKARSSFITHNFIFDDENDFVYIFDNFSQILNIDFCNSIEEINRNYDFNNISTLNYFSYENIVLKMLKIEKKEFSYLLNYIYKSILENRQLYIKLDLKRNEVSFSALLLISIFTNFLPKFILERISFITYVSSLPIDNFFNIIFIDYFFDLEEIKDSYIIDFTDNKNNEVEGVFYDFFYRNLKYGNMELINNNIKLINASNFNKKESIIKDQITKYLKLFYTCSFNKDKIFYNTKVIKILKCLVEISFFNFNYFVDSINDMKNIFVKIKDKPKIIIKELDVIYFLKKEENNFFTIADYIMLFNISGDIFDIINKNIENTFKKTDFYILVLFYLTNLEKLQNTYLFETKIKLIYETIIKKGTNFSNIEIDEKLLRSNNYDLSIYFWKNIFRL